MALILCSLRLERLDFENVRFGGFRNGDTRDDFVLLFTQIVRDPQSYNSLCFPLGSQ
jgi:hypothetical protein